MFHDDLLKIRGLAGTVIARAPRNAVSASAILDAEARLSLPRQTRKIHGAARVQRKPHEL
jgi:hypothetical protein